MSSPFPQSPVVPETFGGGREIRFRCHRGVACWNACCSSIDIALTPYDVLRLKNRLAMDSGAFLREYTVPYEMEQEGIAGVKLKPVEGGTACRFMRPDGCSVYADRPTACRYYPVALLSMHRQGEAGESDSYALVKEPHCRGHDECRAITVDAYRREQGVEAYDELARGWRQLVLKKKSLGPAAGKPSQRSLQLFFMACYDLDRFRAFVRGEGFRSLHDVGDAEMARLEADDQELLQFAFRFLRQTMFGEVTIPMRSETIEWRRARFREKLDTRATQAAARDGDEPAGETTIG
ncbi:MAG TPA: YkgJ family cysteine cluster protein [Usitatibacter sp.]|nr:YkgJ family cysteine cluster protein [Usitatibacter sp.]